MLNSSINRRQFLGLSVAAGIAAGQQTPQQKKVSESVTATASQDKTPRVGIVLSSYTGSKDHDGAATEGLADPQPVNADLTAAQIDAMLRKAIELGNTRQGGLAKLINPDDWVVIKPHIPVCRGQANFHPGATTDPRIVESLLGYLVENKCGARITLAEGVGECGWLSYKKIVADFSRQHPGVQFEIAGLSSEETLEMPVPGNEKRTYRIPKTIQQCDKLISLSPLKTSSETGVSLSMGNYFGISKTPLTDEVMVDLFSFHPADYAIIGGGWGAEGDGVPAHHNVILAGPNAVAVDAVGASVMGFAPDELPFLKHAWRRGFGIFAAGSIWNRGNRVAQARRVFRRPSKWTAK